MPIDIVLAKSTLSRCIPRQIPVICCRWIVMNWDWPGRLVKPYSHYTASVWPGLDANRDDNRNNVDHSERATVMPRISLEKGSFGFAPSESRLFYCKNKPPEPLPGHRRFNTVYRGVPDQCELGLMFDCKSALNRFCQPAITNILSTLLLWLKTSIQTVKHFFLNICGQLHSSLRLQSPHFCSLFCSSEKV